MNAADILKAAAATLDQRGKDYDQPEGERSMGRIVATFNALTGHDLTEPEGWQFMACLKLVRMGTASDPTDSAVDCAAYAALAGEALWHDKERTARNKAAWAAQAAAPDPDDEGNPDCGKVIPGLAACIAKSREVFGGTQPDDGGWIQWEGGDCPVDGDVYVEIRLSDGTETIGAARMLRWANVGTEDDIVAYRLAEQEAPDQKQERWVPKDGENYFSVGLSASEVMEATWMEDYIDRRRAAFGNVFRTREEAEDKLSEILGEK